MTDTIPGIHHVTAIASDPQRNVDFYTEVLGLRLVKQTVNFDDPQTYHLYYGDELGHPGTILTFFPFEGTQSGRVGPGQVSATAFVVPEGSADYWLDRLREFEAEFDLSISGTEQRFGETVVRFSDYDGQPLELVESGRNDDIDPWTDGPVPTEHAIRGFHGVTLDSSDFEGTKTVLETLGYEKESEGDEGDRTRYRAASDRACVVDLRDASNDPRGLQGAGTVHHVAFRTPDDESQLAWRERLTEEGLRVTEVKDRQYFRSIYFREPGGVLFEIATDPPGFTRDEEPAELGSSLKLPPWLEDDRERLQRGLANIDVSRAMEADR
ncbi:ring-cleaving dioxygenase [Halorussus halophilus]|uniref:ring-cleaving dioxygenase n=1 Tax=Halorussus halophilus TaxID=2650975 RepID=UPI00130181B9|nr:ring-cleaving dioxygenase [Halorussus halophilus]